MLILQICTTRGIIQQPALNCNTIDDVEKNFGLTSGSFYLVTNGRVVQKEQLLHDGTKCHLIPRVLGGKGGFGSMLRAIGAQIEKTTSREACRDLSGRRIRDVNNEKKLKEWVAKQADREQEKAERRRKRRERLTAEPNLKFDDPVFNQQYAQCQQNLEEAIKEGLQKTTHGASSTSRKRKADDEPSTSSSSKRRWEWIGVDVDSSDLNSEDEENSSASAGSESKSKSVSTVDETSTDMDLDKNTDAPAIDPLRQTETDSKLSSELLCSSQEPEIVTKVHPSAGQWNDDIECTTQLASSTLIEGLKQPEFLTQQFIEGLKQPEFSTQQFIEGLKQPEFSTQQFIEGLKQLPEFSTEVHSATEQLDQASKHAEEQISKQRSSLLTMLPPPSAHVKDGSVLKPKSGVTPIILEEFNSIQELEELGLECLKMALIDRGLKCGGTLQERAQRLFSVKGLAANEIPPSLLAKPSKGNKKS